MKRKSTFTTRRGENVGPTDEKEETEMRHFYKLASVIAVLFIWAGAAQGDPDTFSIDRDSEAAIAKDLLPPDILTPGPTINVPLESLGLSWDEDLGTGDDLNALSAGLDSFARPPVFFFSVDRDSVGIDGNPQTPIVSDVFEEAASGQAAGDVFVTIYGHPGVPIWSAPVGQNMLHINQSELGMFPAILPTQDYTGQDIIDDLDALNFTEFDMDGNGSPDVNVYFSLDSLSTSLGTLGATADDILLFAPGAASAMVFADGENDIGLQEGDDLDALVLLDLGTRGEIDQFGDRAFFSLAPGSPTLVANGYSPADIFYTNFNGTFVREFTAAQLGLLATDDVDALEAEPGAYVPEPQTLF
ncbi:MAG: hypothetical protein AMK75_05340, partial [Planctomycetes bacterium SM23_65]